jgi:hypothetical protein
MNEERNLPNRVFTAMAHSAVPVFAR